MFAARRLITGMADDFSLLEREILEHFLILGHEVAAVAIALRARYVSAQVRLSADELVVFSFEDGRVWVTGRGYEGELTALAGVVTANTHVAAFRRPLTTPTRHAAAHDAPTTVHSHHASDAIGNRGRATLEPVGELVPPMRNPTRSTSTLSEPRRSKQRTESLHSLVSIVRRATIRRS
jgi:hypothetical protein